MEPYLPLDEDYRARDEDAKEAEIARLRAELEKSEAMRKVSDAGYRKLMADAQALRATLAKLNDPAAVWAGILNGTIARPSALDHYEECKAEVERLSAASEALRRCQSAAGHPDPAEACRIIIEIAREALEEER